MFTSSLVRTSKVHGLHSLMIACRSYKYKATSSHCDPTIGGQAAFWVSVELLKARGHGGVQPPVSVTSFCAALHPCIPPPFHSSFLASQPLPSPGVPAGICQETEHFHTSCLCEDCGHFFFPLQCSFQNISESFF